MSLKRRIDKLEKKTGKGKKGVIFYDVVVDDVGKDNEPIYHYEKATGDTKISLTLDEYEKDVERELKKGNTIILDDVVGLDELSTRELKLLVGKE